MLKTLILVFTFITFCFSSWSCDEYLMQFGDKAEMTETEMTYHLYLSRQWLLRLLKMKKKGPAFLVKQIDGGIHGQDVEFWSGLPEYAEVIKGSELGVVRHYGPFAQEIVESKKLIAGSRPFIDPVAAHLRLHYEDLNGIFFTRKDFPAEKLWMGYDNATPYVDFLLPDDLEVIKLTDGNFLIPGPPRRADWIKKAYQEYKQTGTAYPGLENAFKQIEESGGVDIPLEIPIKVEGYSY